MATSQLARGKKIRLDEEVYTVEQQDGVQVQLRSNRGALLTIDYERLLSAPDFHIFGGEDDDGPMPVAAPDWDNMPPSLRAAAEVREKHLNEAWTGYEGGHPELAKDGEPRPPYDPDLTTLVERVNAKARELGSSMRTLMRQRTAYRRHGIWGLVNKRELRPRAPLGKTHPEVLAVLEAVVRERTNDSTLSELQYRRLAWKRVKKLARFSDCAPLSRSTFNRIFREITRGRATTGFAENRRSIATRPPTPYRHLYVSRPGEVVVVDMWDSDVYAIDPFTFKWVNVVLMIAQDIYTRSIVAWRFGPRGPKGIDAALLLADIIRPKPMRPHWPETARWRYPGVPERLVVPLGKGEPVAGIPVVAPETVVADHGKVFQSRRFRDACLRLRCNLQPTRTYKPTDKAHTERVFRTFRESLFEYMPGYKGHRVYARGEDVEAGAIYFIDEIEDYFAEWVATDYQLKPHDGLHLPTTPKLSMSPNQMYDEGVARAGFLTVPRDPTIYYDLLRPEWRTIQSYGVEIDGLRYDGEPLEAYRNRKSPYKGRDERHSGEWLFRCDPRDVSHVYFEDPNTGEWSALRWINAVSPSRPFTATTLAWAKLRIQREGGDVKRHEELSGVVNRLLDHVVDGSIFRTPQERLRAVKMALEVNGAQRDRQQLGLLAPVATNVAPTSTVAQPAESSDVTPMEVAHDDEDDWEPWEPPSTNEEGDDDE